VVLQRNACEAGGGVAMGRQGVNAARHEQAFRVRRLANAQFGGNPRMSTLVANHRPRLHLPHGVSVAAVPGGQRVNQA